MKAHLGRKKVKPRKKPKIILAIIISVLVLLIAGNQVWRYRELKQIEQAQQEAAYAIRLRVIDGQKDRPFLHESEYCHQVHVGDYTCYYNTTIAYINWRSYCHDTGDKRMEYDDFVQAMLNPEETADSWNIMKWINAMRETENTSGIRESFICYLNDEEFLDQFSDMYWPSAVDVDLCDMHQLEILFDYHMKQMRLMNQSK